MRKPGPQTSQRNHPAARKACIVAPDPAGPGTAKDRRHEQPQGRGQRPGQKPGKRFVEPYPFTEAQRNGIAAGLAQLGLGDEMSRDIFIGAIAYDLAVLESALRADADAPEPAPADTGAAAPPASEPKPQSESEPRAPTGTGPMAGTDLAHAAGALAEALAALPAGARDALCRALAEQDTYRRDYGADYLAVLGLEVGRLAAAAAQLTEPVGGDGAPHADADGSGHARDTQPARAIPDAADRPDPGAGAGAGFIRHAAAVYEQCFDARPGVELEQPFVRALGAVAEHTGVAIPLAPEQLEAALTQR